MSDYPRLTEMGVTHPKQIVHFSVSSIDYNDFLRIVYERPTDSLRPLSRSYRFPRVQKTLKGEGDAGDDTVVMESSPAFKEALAELQALMGEKQDKQDIAAAMLDELRQLEEDFSMRIECLESLIGKLKDS